MKFHFITLIPFFLISGLNLVFAQDKTSDLMFLSYLKNANKTSDIRLLCGNLDYAKLSNDEVDSVNFYIGWSYYFDKKLDSSIIYFDKINDNAPIKTASAFFKSFALIYNGQTNKAQYVLNKISVEEALTHEMKHLFNGASFLLDRNYTAFDSCVKHFTYNQFQLAENESNLILLKDDLIRKKEKSPLMAATLSAIVPGLGKYYAGYFGKAISSFLPCAALAAMSIESYIKGGATSVPFIISASLFSVFYIGNIYGTYYSVNIHRKEFNQKMNNEILLNVHIPLRRIYN
jgi:hypothetical protein